MNIGHLKRHRKPVYKEKNILTFFDPPSPCCLLSSFALSHKLWSEAESTRQRSGRRHKTKNEVEEEAHDE